MYKKCHAAIRADPKAKDKVQKDIKKKRYVQWTIVWNVWPWLVLQMLQGARDKRGEIVCSNLHVVRLIFLF